MTGEKRIKLVVKIQSTSDIITNSSSEVFLCKKTDNAPIEELKKFLIQYHNDHKYKGSWSNFDRLSQEEQDAFDIEGGMGGEFELTTFKDAEGDPWRKELFQYLDDPQNYLFIRTDQCHYATIKWIRENLNIVYSDC